MKESHEVRRQAGTQAALAAALCGALPILVEANVILFSLTLASIAVLLLSALVLILPDRFSSSIRKWFVVDVELAAAGLGLTSTGISLFQLHWRWLGIPMLF